MGTTLIEIDLEERESSTSTFGFRNTVFSDIMLHIYESLTEIE